MRDEELKALSDRLDALQAKDVDVRARLAAMRQERDQEIELALLDVTVITEWMFLARLENLRRVTESVGGVIDEVRVYPAGERYWRLHLLARVPPQGQTGMTDHAKRLFGGVVEVSQYGTAIELRQADGETSTTKTDVRETGE